MPNSLTTAPDLLAVIRCRSLAEQAKAALNEAVITARSSGHTWREIAIAMCMTEHAVASLHRRAVEAAGR